MRELSPAYRFLLAGFLWSFGGNLVSQSAHFCTPTPHQDGSLGFPATSPTIPKGWA